MGRSSSAEGGTRAKRPTGGITKMHKDLKNYSEKDFRRVHGKSKSAARQALAKENYSMATGSAGLAQSEKPTPPRVKKKKVLEWGTSEATARAKNMTPGEVNEAGFVNRKDNMPAGKELGKVMKDQGKTFFQSLNDRKARGVKSKPIDKDKFFGKLSLIHISEPTRP